MSPGVVTLASVLLMLSAPVSPAGTDGASEADASSAIPLPPEFRVHADGAVTLRVCFNWSCARRQRMQFTAADMAQVAQHMALCPGAGFNDELQRVRIGIWQLEVLAQKYQPLLANDEPINATDQDSEGRMDCVDNATNTTTYLHLLQELGLVPGWSTSEPRVRDRFSSQVHWTAVALHTLSARRWAVDSWFRGNGNLPFILPLDDWLEGRIAWQSPLDVFSPYPRYSNQLCGS